MIRFFVTPDDIFDSTIQLKTEDSAHIRSLRLRPDELFVISDGNCNDYICRLSSQTDENATVADIVEKRKAISEPTVKCVAYIAYAKGERLDYAVQKSVELGVHEVILFESSRCVAIPKNIPKKLERLQRIAFETAKQSGRGIVPKVSSTGNFKSVIKTVTEQPTLPLFFYESENNLHLKKALEQEQELHSVSIITGPEGGFEPHEVEYATSKNIRTISLGPRILRCETAPIAALAAIMYHTENL